MLFKTFLTAILRATQHEFANMARRVVPLRHLSFLLHNASNSGGAFRLTSRPFSKVLSLDGMVVELLGRGMFRLQMEPKPWKEDDQQSGKHVPSGAPCLLHGQLHLLASL